MTKATLEDVYAAVATGIDEAGPQREALFLAKIVLLLAQELDDPDRALGLVRAGLDGLDGMAADDRAAPPRSGAYAGGTAARATT